MRAIVAFLLLMSACSTTPCVCPACDQQSTANRSDYMRQLDCVRCIEACIKG